NANNGNVPTTSNGVNPADYKGTTVVFATTILSKTDESGPVVDAFESKYGITVKEVLVKDNVNEIAGKIAAGEKIDVMRSNSDFPAAMAVLQSLTAAKLDYTDPIWDKSMFEFTTFGGEPYLCNTVGNIWSENSCIIYNKQLLKKAGAKTPEQYDAAGAWTVDAFAAIAKAVEGIDGVGTGVRGAYVQGEEFLGSIGCGLYKYENGKFTNGLKDPKMAEAMAKLASWRKEGFMTDSANDPFEKGNVGICYGLAGWSLKKNGSNAKANWNNIGFYKMPAYAKGQTAMNTAMIKAWGICRSAANPVAGGLFLRYYLDCGNYNSTDAFISPAAADFFFQNTNSLSMDNFFPQLTREQGTEKLTGFYEWEWEKIGHGDPAQVQPSIAKISTSVDKAVDVMNKHVAKNTGIK
ncbi:MAG: extracellular solute-binding protein, partial [Clostridia bacterium]|nr:extracellular solute-binding protein [Clostridia bacterium]